MDMKKYDHLELSRIVGEPVDPRRAFPKIVEEVCDTDTAPPNEYTYYYDVLANVEKAINITGNGALAQVNVTPDSPALLSFIDVATQEQWVKYIDLAQAKERTLARVLRNTTRSLNTYETYKVISLLSAAASTNGSNNLITSGNTGFAYNDLIIMMEEIMDYGDSFVLICGTTIWKDIMLWNWTYNKYQSLSEALTALNIKIVRIPPTMSGTNFQYADDGSGGGLANTTVLGDTTAYLVARDTEAGKPLLWVRRELNAVEQLGGQLVAQGDGNPQRLVFFSANPVTRTSDGARFLAVAATGYEEIAGAVKNYHAVSKFTRS